MIVYSHPIHNALRPFIKSVDYMEVNVMDFNKKILSLDLFCSTEPALFFTVRESKDKCMFRGKDISHYKAYFFGQFTSKQTFLINNKVCGVQVVFKPLGPYYLFGLPQYHFIDAIEDGFDFLPGLKDILSRLEDRESDRIGFANILENYFLTRLSRYEQPDSLRFLSMYDYIKEQRGCRSVKELCYNSSISKTRLEAHFKEKIGISPKKLSCIVRFQSLLKEIKTYPDIRWNELVYKYGYFDQNHFIKEFKVFTGITPTQYIRMLGVTESAHLYIEEG